jgi:hypothetical protein
VLAEHYAGDDTNVRTLAAGVLAAHGGISVEDFNEPGQRVPSASRTCAPKKAGTFLRPAGPLARSPGHLAQEGSVGRLLPEGDQKRPLPH